MQYLDKSLDIEFSIFTTDTNLEKVLIEKYDNFIIYWFKWPKDGILPIPDYEPIIVLLKQNNEQCMIITRRHWRYQPYQINEIFHPLRILFHTNWHESFVLGPSFFSDFESTKLNRLKRILGINRINNSNQLNNFLTQFKKIKYDKGFLNKENIVKEDIPSQYRNGINHLSNLSQRAITDPIDKAREFIEDCNQTI